MPPITDFHTHAFPDDLAEHAVRELEKLQDENQDGACLDGTIKDLLRSMDAAGIDRSVICSIATEPKQVGSILAWSQTISSHRIIPFGSLHPDMEHPDKAADEMVEHGIPGVKLHPLYQGFDLGDRSTWRLFEVIEPRPLICVSHCGLDFAFPPDDERAHPEKLGRIHEHFPDIPLVAAHMGGWKRWDSVVEHLVGLDIYLETSYTLGYIDRATLRKIVKRHATENILLGSDSPWQDQKKTLEGIREWFDRDVMHKITALNAENILSGVNYQPPGGG